MSMTIDSVLDRFEPATPEQIRTWSSGPVKRRLRAEERRDDWRLVKDTLWDQHIFGCVSDWECACGKFKGYSNAKVICDICGVRVLSDKSRETRFGHVNLTSRIPHPFFADAEPLDVIPIVPACFWSTAHGEPLAMAYEEVLRCSLSELSAEDIMGAFGMVLAHLEKLFESETAHDTEHAERLARGMLLKLKDTSGVIPLSELAAQQNVVSSDDDEDESDWGDLSLAPIDEE